MSEMAKTITFVAVAAGSLLLAFAVNSNIDQFDVDSLIGERLNQFGVNEPKRLKIVKFDTETATTREFEVAAKESLWTIPSKQDYPADAAEQMAEAATCLIDREVLRVAAKDASQHQELGVVDPNSTNLDSKAEGVGIRVTMTDINDGSLTDMIIGNPVKDAEGLYHIRSVDQDVVYVVELNPDKLSTNFEDWIEDDLLKLNALDIKSVQIKDYSAEMQPILTGNGIQMQVSWDRRGEFSLSYDNNESKWIPDSLQKYDAEKKELVEFALTDDEELNNEALTDLRTGLDDLLLVDVERKPEGLSADLKAGDGFLDNQDAIESLVGRGFAPIVIEKGADAEILSSEGEIICTLKDGIEYVLRFGNLKVNSDAASQSESTEDGTKDSGAGIHRYLFVMARLNESVIEKPELAELPALPEDSTAEEKTEEEPAEESSSEETKETEPANEEKIEATEETASKETAAEETPETDSDTEESDSEEVETETVDPDQPAVEEPSETSEETTEEETTEEETTEEETTEEEKPEEEKPEEEKPVDLEQIIAERKSIEEENQRQRDEYQDNIKAAQERVQELNERFGDWYYVISNDVYKKIHLGREQLITEKKDEAEQPAAGLPAGFPAGGIPGLPALPPQ